MDFNTTTSEDQPFLCEHCERATGVKLTEVRVVHGEPVLAKRILCMECGWVRVVA